MLKKPSRESGKQALRFTASSLLSTVVDQLMAWFLFWALEFVMAPGDPMRIFAGTFVARCVSVAVNFSLNSRLVFSKGASTVAESEDELSHGVPRRESLPRFLVLAFGILVLSATGVYLAHMLFGADERIAKLVVDLLLFFLNYTGQRKWVFKPRAVKVNIHGKGTRSRVKVRVKSTR